MLVRVIKLGILRISALTKLLLFCAEAPYNFLGREISMKREVIVGKPSPHSSIYTGWLIVI